MAQHLQKANTGGEDWVFVQKKTFTRWANSYLSKQKLEVGDLSEDLKDGFKLGTLLEVISNERLPKLSPSPKMEIQMLENINKSLTFLKNKGFSLVNIGAKDIYSGNEKIILGLLWTIILRFEVGDQDGKNGLLLWVQRTCKSYRDVDPPNVQNFSADWNTGLPFCAIIHKFRPDLLDYDSLVARNAEHNCELAFSIAQDKLGIPRMLDVSDVANVARPDDKSVIAYVVQFFKLFARANKNEALVKSIRNAVEVTRRHETFMEKYAADSSEVLAFCQWSFAKMSTPSTSKSTPEVKKELEDFTAFMRTEKPKMQAERAGVEAVLTQLINSKRNNNRPPYSPELSIQMLNQEWQSLEAAEQSRERLLLDKYNRFQQVDAESAKIYGSSQAMKQWLETNLASFASLPNTLGELEGVVDRVEGFLVRLKQYQHIFSTLEQGAGRVEQYGKGEHEECEKVSAWMDTLRALLTRAEQEGLRYKAQAETELNALRQRVLESRAFKRCADAVEFDLDHLESSAKGAVVVNCALDVEELKKETQTLETELTKCHQAMKGKDFTSPGGAVPDTVKRVEAKFAAVSELVKQRLAVLDAKLQEEKARDTLRMRFATLANALAVELSQISDSLLQGSSTAAALEVQLDQVRLVQTKLTATAAKLDQLDALAMECNASGIVNHPDTPHTIFSLKAQYQALVKAVQDEENALHTQIMAKKSLEVSPEQLKEIAEVFAFFDQDNTGHMGLKELQQACTGAGIDLEESAIEQRMKQAKPNMQFSVEDFTTFMLAEMKAGDTPEAVMNAFSQLGEGGQVTPAQIESAFQSQPSTKEYILSKLENGNFQKFVDDLFLV